MKPRKSGTETSRVVDEIVFQASLLALHAALNQPEEFENGAPAVGNPRALDLGSSGLNALRHSLAAVSSVSATAGVASPERTPR